MERERERETAVVSVTGQAFSVQNISPMIIKKGLSLSL